MILIVDNYDSFVHNLARYVREAGAEAEVVRNDAASAKDLIARAPAGIILSPGPNGPKEAGVCLDLLRILPKKIPLLGVCLGAQCLVEAFGGRTERAVRPLHGEASPITHSGAGIFEGLASPLFAGRYHSLISVLADDSELTPTAWSEENELMAIARRGAPWFGVQFHPESLLTPDGRQIIANFLALTTERTAR